MRVVVCRQTTFTRSPGGRPRVGWDGLRGGRVRLHPWTASATTSIAAPRRILCMRFSPLPTGVARVFEGVLPVGEPEFGECNHGLRVTLSQFANRCPLATIRYLFTLNIVKRKLIVLWFDLTLLLWLRKCCIILLGLSYVLFVWPLIWNTNMRLSLHVYSTWETKI